MAEVIIPSKIGIALDVDGTLVDTNFECYQRTKEAWETKYNQDFPLTYEQFSSFRPLVKIAEDYFSFSKMWIGNNGVLPVNAKDVNERYLMDPDVSELKELFYALRKAKTEKDKKGWVEENKIYDGVPEMMENLGKTGWDVFVITSKNREAVSEILSCHGLDSNIGKIYDKDDGKRPEQFKKASEERDLEMKRIIPYDDLLEQLMSARELGMIPVAAPQGYGINKEIEAHGFLIAWPQEFIETAEKIIKMRGFK
jgi:phosphoglycolate phosphatase-like HAD superfamily hydrolase